MFALRPAFLTLLLTALLSAVAGFLLFAGEGRAIQAPRIGLDMVPAGNGYDAATNTMAVGPIDNCLSSDPPGNDAQHNHIAELVIQEVEDLVGWQVRLNYDGGRMRPASANFSPFPDNGRGQSVSFINLPIDPDGVHRDIVSAGTIPPAAPGAQTALLGATFNGAQNAALTPDTPPKAPPDDTSYSAPTGGILADINLQVLAGQANQGLLTIDLDDAVPNPPGTKAVVFNGAGTSEIDLGEDALFDGFHAEGTVCVPPVTIPPTSPASGGGGGGGGQGSPGGSGTSPGTSPGASPSGQRTLAPGETPTTTPRTSTPTATAGSNSGGSKGDDGGTPAWVWVLIALAVVGLPAAGYAAWRYRSRLPWFGGHA
jgi:hypothetical protein